MSNRPNYNSKSKEPINRKHQNKTFDFMKHKYLEKETVKAYNFPTIDVGKQSNSMTQPFPSAPKIKESMNRNVQKPNNYYKGKVS